MPRNKSVRSAIKSVKTKAEVVIVIETIARRTMIRERKIGSSESKNERTEDVKPSSVRLSAKSVLNKSDLTRSSSNLKKLPD